IAYPDKEKILTKITPANFKNAILSERSGVFQFMGINKHQRIAFFSLLRGYKDYDGQGWHIGLIQDAAEVYQLVFSMQKNIALIAICGVVFIFIFANMLVRNVVKPVNELTEMTRKLAEGNLKVRIEVKRHDEIGELGSAFNKMTSNLRETTISRNELAREVVERKKAEIEMHKAIEHAEIANNAKSRFLAYVSHELRTPLNAIIGYSEIILKSSKITKLHEQASSILSISEKLVNLISSLLDNSKIESGKIVLEKLPFNLSAVLAYIVDMARIETNKKGVEFRISVSEGVPSSFCGDAEQLRHILLNLVGNAVKFTSKGFTRLDIELVHIENSIATLKFLVADTGIGIPKDKQGVIFDVYSQADNSTVKKYGGTGLGTTIAKNLVKLMGGEIGLESEEGKGSIFWFTVPLEVLPDRIEEETLIKEDTIDNLEAGFKDALISSARVLLVDDYSPGREVVLMHLEEMGCKVDVVENGLQAVQAVQKQDYDLVIMDLQMPDMDGYTATRKIRNSGKSRSMDIPIIALTSDATESAWKASIEAGMNDVFTKPIHIASFQSAVVRWLVFSGESRKDGHKIFDKDKSKEALREADNEKPLDYEYSLQEFKKDRPLHSRVVQDFIKAVEAQINVIHEALRNNDAETIRKEAHKIIGGASTLAAMPLAEEARRLEELSRFKNFDNIVNGMKSFEKEFKRLKVFFQEVIDENIDSGR
ncbi:MAG: ATP-binding protein, partial [Candidatus Theseobacter exili]|nr:ATP-binding protein [Candidatus Theseobacter exili]